MQLKVHISRTFLKEAAFTICLALVIFIAIQAILVQIVVEQTSMIPSIEDGQRVLINKVTYYFHDPERGDIIVFNPLDQSGKIPLIKRIVGLPGETVEIESGLVYIDEFPLEEPYIRSHPNYVLAPIIVPEQHYFVLGDNRNNSRDSHQGWTVPEDNIVGKAWISIWPPDKWGLAPNYAYASK